MHIIWITLLTESYISLSQQKILSIYSSQKDLAKTEVCLGFIVLWLICTNYRVTKKLLLSELEPVQVSWDLFKMIKVSLLVMMCKTVSAYNPLSQARLDILCLMNQLLFLILTIHLSSMRCLLKIKLDVLQQV